MGDMIEYARQDGTKVPGYLSKPAGASKGGVVLVHEYWGLREEMKRLADRIASDEAGYTTLVPDLFRGKVINDATEASEHIKTFDFAGAIQDVLGAVATLKKSGGKVAVWGFCMGGGVAVASAIQGGTALDGVVSFYGLPHENQFDALQMKCPFMGHFSISDTWVTVERVEAFKKKLIAAKVPADYNMYESQHGFFNDARPEVYDPFDAPIAWDRTMNFLRDNVG